MFRRIALRGGGGTNASTNMNYRRLIGSITASIARDQPFTCMLPTVQCVAAPLSLRTIVSASARRCYATVGRPRKSNTTTTTKKATPRKIAAAKSTSTSRAKAKPKAKPKKKAAKPKKRTIRLKKPKPKPTELEIKRSKVLALRKVALLDGPKLLPTNSWLVYNLSHVRKGVNPTNDAPERSQAYKNLTASEKQDYESTALQNRIENERIKNDWIRSHTPWEVRIANNARRHLNRIAREPRPAGAGRALVAHSTALLKDPRVVARADPPYIAFCRERWASGDFKDVKAPTASTSLAKEWKALSHEEARKYHDVYRTERVKYAEEYEKLYGKKPESRPKKTAA